MKPISLASYFEPGVYPVYEHQKPTTPYMSLMASKSEWHCCDCNRIGRIVCVIHTGLVTCAKCRSRFMVPEEEWDDAYRIKLSR